MVIFLLLLFFTPISKAMERASVDEQMHQLLLQRKAILMSLMQRPSISSDAQFEYALILRETNHEIQVLNTPEGQRPPKLSRPLRYRIHRHATEKTQLLAKKKDPEPAPTDQSSCCFGPWFRKN